MLETTLPDESNDIVLSASSDAYWEGVTRTYLGKYVQLAFLSPEPIKRILVGEQPAQLSALAPLSWDEQQQLSR